MRAATRQTVRRADPEWRPLLSVAVFCALGGLGGAMLTGEPLVGVAAYYALALIGLASPEGAGLRDALGVSAAQPASAPRPPPPPQ